ncbi:MAG: carbon-nitrogen family hydrolase [Chloroflexi bacterium]|nr:carbon-nitrogen family hydrolase [Chloroflexota bacterium]
MKIAVAQLDCSLGDIDLNCSKITSFAERAKKEGCDLIVFSEMMDTGYEMHTIQETASSWSEQPFITAKRAAANQGIYLICGFSEREESRIYNSVAVFNPSGELIGKYRKIHLLSLDPVNENQYIVAGDSPEIVQIGDMKCGLLICYDIRFPELSRYLVNQGAMVLIVCSAWPLSRQNHWKTLTTARAIENQSYIVAANRVGTDENLTFCGSSCIVDPYGISVVEGSDDREELLIGEVTLEAVNSVRANMPVFEDRREDLYKAWQLG